MNSSPGNILLIDDDDVFSKVFGKELIRMGYKVTQGYGTDVLSSIVRNRIDVVVLDIVMPKINGLELLKGIKRQFPDMDVIMLTGNATIENAISTMKEGAYDYFMKPVELSRVEKILERCMERKRLRVESRDQKNILTDLREGNLIGNSPTITEIKSLINRFAYSNSTVLIYGESGTGKELVANLIHQNSSRREEPFIIIDCTALKESLLESELFGHERGAFTGAVAKKRGIFEIADGGSIFLDEIGDVSPALQAKLLRVVETKSFRRVGGNKRIITNVRLIAATNRDLPEMVNKGEFREDLYYRINVINITMPPIRENKQDIPLLVDHFLKELRKLSEKPKTFSKAAMKTLQEYSWPGNARELKNIVERAITFSENDVIDIDEISLRPSFTNNILRRRHGEEFGSLREMEITYVKWILEKTKGNKQLAAKILKIDRKTITRMLADDSSGE